MRDAVGTKFRINETDHQTQKMQFIHTKQLHTLVSAGYGVDITLREVVMIETKPHLHDIA